MIDINIDIVNKDNWIRNWQTKHYCRDILQGNIDMENDMGNFRVTSRFRKSRVSRDQLPQKCGCHNTHNPVSLMMARKRYLRSRMSQAISM